MGITRQELDSRLPALQPELRTFIRKLVRQSADVDDILQETLLRACQHYPDLQNADKLPAWLRSIARNLVRLQRRPRGGAFTQLLRQAEAKPETGYATAMRTMDDLLAPYAGNHGFFPLLCIGLHCCLQWTARDIAAVVRRPPDTVRRWLVGKRRGHAAVHAKASILFDVKTLLPHMLMTIATEPLGGKHARLRAVAAESVALAKLLLHEFPTNATVSLRSGVIFVQAAKFSEYAGDEEPTRPFDKWRRELWDSSLLQLGLRHLRQAARDSASEQDLLIARQMLEFYQPATTAQVRWDRVLELCRKINRLGKPQPSSLLNEAKCLRMLQGPRAAARQLWMLRNNENMRNSRFFYHDLGYYLLESGRWRDARRWFRRYLRYPIDDTRRAEVERWIRQCEERT